MFQVYLLLQTHFQGSLLSVQEREPGNDVAFAPVTFCVEFPYLR